MQPTAQLLLVPRVIWFALTVSQFMYLFIAYTIRPSATPSDSLAQFLLPALGLAVIQAAIAIFMFRKFLAFLALTPEERAAPDLTVVYRGKLAKAFVSLIIALAMSESICIIGFLLAFIGGQVERMLPFLGIGLALNAYMFPRVPVASPGA